MPIVSRIEPCLWFDTQAEEAANFYVGIFPNSRVTNIARYPNVGQELHGGNAGSVMTASFVLDGQPFLALNAGPSRKFNEALSLMINCDTQAEIDYYWEKLGAGGDSKAQQCGWLKDQFGLSWQVVPREWEKLMSDPDPKRAERAFAAMMKMKKLDLAALQSAAGG